MSKNTPIILVVIATINYIIGIILYIISYRHMKFYTFIAIVVLYLVGVILCSIAYNISRRMK
jgi:ABC-type multidrug transport system permease subunit